MKKVYVIGTCDTKDAELRYAVERVRAAGAAAVLVDISTTPGSTAADVTPAMPPRSLRQSLKVWHRFWKDSDKPGVYVEFATGLVMSTLDVVKRIRDTLPATLAPAPPPSARSQWSARNAAFSVCSSAATMRACRSSK